MDSATTLASLAMLKVNIDDGKDYLEYLRPYIVHVLQKTNPEAITDALVADELRNLCGLEIPVRTVNIILQRLARDGQLIKAHGIYTISRLPEGNFEADKAATVRHLDSVSAELVTFAKVEAEREITAAEATDSIVAFLSQFSISCLKSFLRSTALPKFGSGEGWQIVLVGQFVQKISGNPNLFDSFMKFVEGHMLANALLCPDLQQVSNTYEQVSFYLDTPILIKLLGLEGPEEKHAVEELIRLVKRLRGRFYYFPHTEDELTTSIRSSAEFINNPKGRGSIVEFAKSSNRTKSDLLLIAEKATTTLDNYEIYLVQAPSYDQVNHRYEIGEQEFASVLDEEINYHNPRARDYDIRSVRSIYVLRKGLTPQSIERSKAVFVTSNTSFSKAAFEYGKKHDQSREVSTVITDFSLANTAWLKAPHGASTLPQKEVLALAYASTQPTPKFWNRVLEEIDKLQELGEISARDHQLLRSSKHVQEELMKLTLGSEASLTKESITTTVKRVTEEIRKEDARQIQQITNVSNSYRDELIQEKAQVQGIRESIYGAANARATREANIGSLIIWVMQIGISLVGFLALFSMPNEKWWAYLLVFFGIASSLVRLAGTKWEMKPHKARPMYITWRREILNEKKLKEIGMQKISNMNETNNPN